MSTRQKARAVRERATSLRWASAMVRSSRGSASGVPRSPGRFRSTMLGTTASPRPASTNRSTASISPPSTARRGSKPAARQALSVVSRTS